MTPVYLRTKTRSAALLRTLGLGAATLLGDTAAGAIPPPVAPPLAAFLELPRSGVQNTSQSTTPPATLNPTFVWVQGGFSASMPQPLEARYFMICLQPAGSTNCHWGGRWYAPTNTISRVQLRNPASGQLIPNQFRYTYRVPSALRPTDLDRPMEWIVGSCSGQSTAECTLSAPRPIHFATRNLKKIDIAPSFTPTMTGATLSADYFVAYEDPAGTNSPPYNFTLTMVEARINSSWRCLQDPFDASVQPGDRVLLNDARVVALTDPFNVADVIAILPVSGQQFMTVQGANTGQAPGAQGQALVPHPTGSLLWSGNAPAAAVAMTLVADTSNAIVEYNEKDNAAAECKHVIRPM